MTTKTFNNENDYLKFMTNHNAKTVRLTGYSITVEYEDVPQYYLYQDISVGSRRVPLDSIYNRLQNDYEQPNIFFILLQFTNNKDNDTVIKRHSMTYDSTFEQFKKFVNECFADSDSEIIIMWEGKGESLRNLKYYSSFHPIKTQV